MTDKASIRSVIEWLEKANGPDRMIDVDIAFAVGLKYRADPLDWGWLTPHWSDGFGWTGHLPEYTASVDAAIVLTKRILPGYGWRVGKYAAFVWSEDAHYRIEVEDAATPAINLLLALFKALLAKEGE